MSHFIVTALARLNKLPWWFGYRRLIIWFKTLFHKNLRFKFIYYVGNAQLIIMAPTLIIKKAPNTRNIGMKETNNNKSDWTHVKSIIPKIKAANPVGVSSTLLFTQLCNLKVTSGLSLNLLIYYFFWLAYNMNWILIEVINCRRSMALYVSEMEILIWNILYMITIILI